MIMGQRASQKKLIDHLDVFRGVSLPSNPTVHCYGFSSDANPHADIIKVIRGEG